MKHKDKYRKLDPL